MIFYLYVCFKLDLLIRVHRYYSNKGKMNADDEVARKAQQKRNIISNFVQARGVSAIFGMLQNGMISDVDVRDPTDFHRTCLMFQCYRGDIPAVKALLSLGANPNLDSEERAGDGFRSSALANAIWKNNKELTMLLLQYGADRNIRCGTYYGTVFDIAKLKGFDEIVYILETYFPLIVQPDIYQARKVVMAKTNTGTPPKMVFFTDFTTSPGGGRAAGKSVSPLKPYKGITIPQSNDEFVIPKKMIKKETDTEIETKKEIEKKASRPPYRLRPIHEPLEVIAARERRKIDLRETMEKERLGMIKSEAEENAARVHAFLTDTTDFRTSIANRVASYRMKSGDFKTPSQTIIVRHNW
jgi:hypothetical protein